MPLHHLSGMFQNEYHSTEIKPKRKPSPSILLRSLRNQIAKTLQELQLRWEEGPPVGSAERTFGRCGNSHSPLANLCLQLHKIKSSSHLFPRRLTPHPSFPIQQSLARFSQLIPPGPLAHLLPSCSYEFSDIKAAS